MKQNCSLIQDLLADGEITPLVKSHVENCVSCSNIAASLSILDQQLTTASSLIPPRQLNEDIFDFIDDSEKNDNELLSPLPPIDLPFAKFSVSILSTTLLFLLFIFLPFDSTSQAKQTILAFTFDMIGRHGLGLLQAVVIISGSLSLYICGTKKLLICSLSVGSLLAIEFIRLVLGGG